MHDTRLEDSLRRALHEEADALPFTITVDDLNVRLAQRPRPVSRLGILSAAAAVVIVVGAGAFLANQGPGSTVGNSPQPSTAGSFPADLESYDALHRAAGPETAVLLQGERIGVATGDDNLVTYDIGTVAEAGFHDIIWDCSGPGPFAVGWRMPGGGAVFSSTENPTCDGPGEIFSSPEKPADAVLFVSASPATSWRVMAYTPRPDDLSTIGPPMASLPPMEHMSFLGGLSDDPGNNDLGSFQTAVPAGTDDLTAVVGCSGDGSIQVTDATATYDFVCQGPSIHTSFRFVPGASGSVRFEVQPTGDISWAVDFWAYDLEDNPNAKFIPPTARLTEGGGGGVDSELGCGLGYTLADGSTAADSCGPYNPLIPLDRALHVDIGSGEVTVALPDGWVLTGLSGEVVATSDMIANGDDTTYSPLVDMDGGSATATFATPGLGDWTFRLSINAERGGDSYGVPYFFRVIVEP